MHVRYRCLDCEYDTSPRSDFIILPSGARILASVYGMSSNLTLETLHAPMRLPRPSETIALLYSVHLRLSGWVYTLGQLCVLVIADFKRECVHNCANETTSLQTTPSSWNNVRLEIRHRGYVLWDIGSTRSTWSSLAHALNSSQEGEGLSGRHSVDDRGFHTVMCAGEYNYKHDL